MRGEHPIEVAVERGMAALAAGEAGQGRHEAGAPARERVEKRDPARQAAKTGEKAELWPAALLPDPAGEAVDFDGRGSEVRHWQSRGYKPPPQPSPACGGGSCGVQ